MPFVFGPAYARDPIAELFAAALGAETTKDKPAACRQAGACQPRRRVYKRIINPSFDVSELENEYVLEGELPGVSDKSTIAISFDDAQTIVIKGELKRATRHAPSTEAEHTEAVASDAASSKTLTNDEQPQEKIKYAATVEEDTDESEADFEVVDGPNGPRADKGKAKETGDVEMAEAKPTEPQTEEKQEPKAPSAKYWVTERSIGVFERRFNFQGLIDQDNVRASLENGLLTVVIPKRQAYVRQVQIQ